MPTAGSETFKTRKARLRASFLAQLPQRLLSAREQTAKLQVGAGQGEAISALHLLFHTIKGSGASFGFADIASIAAEADDALKQAQRDGDQVSQGLLATLNGLIERLHEAGPIEPDPPADPQPDPQADPDTGPNTDGAIGRKPTTPTAPAQSRAATETQAPETGPDPLPAGPRSDSGSERRDKVIFLCDDDQQVAEELSSQLACFGYRVTPFLSPDDLCDAVSVTTPAALIMDVVFPEGEHAGPESLAGIFALAGSPIPCVFISANDGFSARLQAVKAGGSAYCLKPVKTTEIVELLDGLTQGWSAEPFHVVVVDDDPDIARWHALVLEEAGMEVRFATRPSEVLDLLAGFNADLVLMDMYMPECSGPELARVLRQMPGYVSLPIIYVSSETDIDVQFEAMEVGADGFLTKPIDRNRLVTEISLRAERMRALHGLMVRDGLTGLFNHNTIMQFLEVGLADARRSRRDLCFAMIDVDRFKRVNDTYGHPAGDQVLMGLSRGLKLRLRGSDLVGRYGGEEFAIVLSGVDAVQAKCILDELREKFSSVVFQAGDEKFTCTFSGGIASFPMFSSTDGLTEAADLALYRAKHGGRNRIEIATAADRGARDQEKTA